MMLEKCADGLARHQMDSLAQGEINWQAERKPGFPSGNIELRRNARGERHQRCPALNHMCNQSKLMVRRQVR